MVIRADEAAAHAPPCACARHETTDSDLFEFRPAKASRDGLPLPEETIPDGYYLIGTPAAADPQSPERQWLGAIIDGVRTITHIAPPDADEIVSEIAREITSPHAPAHTRLQSAFLECSQSWTETDRQP